MNSLVLVHLGEGTPLYMNDCFHQLRLWNSPETLTIFLILDSFHRGTPYPWSPLTSNYDIQIIYTDELIATDHHQSFCKGTHADLQFRDGYWKFVKERFFFVEELMLQRGLTNVIMMEYDILIYTNLNNLIPALQAHTRGRLPMVMDNETRGHPGFLYFETIKPLHAFNMHLLYRLRSNKSDMELLCEFSQQYPEDVCFLPVLTPSKNSSIVPRKTQMGQVVANPFFLSDGFDILQCLFDSAVVGQAIGGIDPRNTNGANTIGYENENALYSLKEMRMEWQKNGSELWRPLLDGIPLVTIHMHSKALYPFLSDRSDMPKGDFNMGDLFQSLMHC